MLTEPRCGGADYSRLLASIHREFGRTKAPGSPGLDLDEDHQSSAACDQVDLDPVVADVPGGDAIPSAHQEGCCMRFTLSTQNAPRIAPRRICFLGAGERVHG